MANRSSQETNSRSFSLISRRRLLELYTSLLRCRILEQELASETWRSAGVKLGHAAPAVALVIDLRAGDVVAAPSGDLLPEFVRSQSRLGTFPLRLTSAVPRPTFAVQVESAFASARQYRRSNSGNVAVIFAARAHVAGAAWRNALAAAERERLPILFVSPGQPASGAERMPARPGFPVIDVDRDDVVALYRVACEALAHARRGNGATLIRCQGWPALLAQSGNGGDAIASMERYLAAAGIPAVRTRAAAALQFRRKLTAALASPR